jgi:hypothetical protein
MSEAIFNDVFGRLTWDDRVGCWRGEIEWSAGQDVGVSLWHPGYDVARGLRLAGDSLAWLQAHELDARRLLAEEIYEGCSDAWEDDEDEGKDPVTVTSIFRRLALMRIGFGEDGSLVLTYDVAELLAGQLVDAEFAPDRTFQGAYLVD